jgi:hypothetical protein
MSESLWGIHRIQPDLLIRWGQPKSYYRVHDGNVDLDLALLSHLGQIWIHSGSVSRSQLSRFMVGARR